MTSPFPFPHPAHLVTSGTDPSTGGGEGGGGVSVHLTRVVTHLVITVLSAAVARRVISALTYTEHETAAATYLFLPWATHARFVVMLASVLMGCHEKYVAKIIVVTVKNLQPCPSRSACCVGPKASFFLKLP